MDHLNAAIDHLEANLAAGVDAAELARRAFTSEHHLRRMFATLAGLGLADYVRRRRMTLAALELRAEPDATVLEVAQRWGYSSGDSFARAFRAVHGVSPDEARSTAVALAIHPRISFQLTTTGGSTVHHRLVTTRPMRLVGRSTRVPLVHRGPNPDIAAFVASIPIEETLALKSRNDTEPRGVLAVCTEMDDDRADGSTLRYLHGVATTEAVDDDGGGDGDLEVIELPETAWAVFQPADNSDEALQTLWPYVFTEWFPASGTQLAAGPEIVAMQQAPDGSGLVRELWIPIEPAERTASR